VERFGPASDKSPNIGKQDRPQATDKLAIIASLRDMLNDDGIKGNARAIASIVRTIRELS
jgi:hypothetical protein